MQGSCKTCGKTGDMNIHWNGRQYCSWPCQKKGEHRPNMTEETYKEDTVIDEFEYKGQKLVLETPEWAYTQYSGYRYLLVVYSGLFTRPKQVGGFKTLKEAKDIFDKMKKKYIENEPIL